MHEGNLMVDCPFCNDENRSECEFCMGSGEIAHDDIPLGDSETNEIDIA